MNFSIIYDIIFIAVLSYCVISCYRKGFLNSLFSAVGYVFSFFVSHFSRKFMTKFFLFSGLFGNFSKSNASGGIFGTGLSEISKGCFLPVSNSEPSNFLNFDAVENFNCFGGNPFKFVFGSSTSFIISALLFFAMFRFFKLFLKRAIRFSKFLNKLPVIGSIDGILGGVCGVFKAAFFLFIISFLCFFVIVLTQNNLYWLNFEVLKNTQLFLLVCKLCPFCLC